MNRRIIFLVIIITVVVVFLSCAAPSKIGKSIDKNLMDGIYQGSYSKFPVKAVVDIKIENNKIVEIKIIKHTTWKGKKAEGIVEQCIIEQQSTNVDSVSGATHSSHVIMNAVQNAVEKAYQD